MVRRENYLTEIKPFMDKPVIKVITGMRRTGKTVFLKMLMEEVKKKKTNKVLYINMESFEFEFIKDATTLNNYIKKKLSAFKNKKYLFIDEVQEIKNWEKAINSLLSEGFADIYLTGSNAKMLSSELSTHLTGRFIEFRLYPLSFSEFLQFRTQNNKKTTVEQEFENFLKYGGLPGLHNFELTENIIFQYLQDIFNTLLFKDVVSKNKIRDIPVLEMITRFAFDNIGNLTTSKKIADYFKTQKLKISNDTVINYLAYLCEAFMLYKLKRFDIKGKRILEINEKYFVSDLGLRHANSGFKNEDISKQLENLILLELLKRRFKITIGKLNENEIDFIAEKNGVINYIQVCYLLASKEIEDREFGVLYKIRDNHPKFIFSLDKHWGFGKDGIRHINIMDFLMGATGSQI